MQWEDKPTSVGEKIEIDPTLMEPLKPMPVLDDERVSSPAPPFPNATGQNRAIPTPLPFSPPPQFAQPMPPPLAPPPLVPPPLAPSVAIPTPPPMPAPPGLFSITGANQAIPPGLTNVEVLDLTSRPRPDLTDGNTGFFRESGEIPRYPTESTDAINPSRKRTLVIAIGAALAITAVLVVVVFALGGSKKKTTKPDTGSSAPIVNIGSGSAIASGSGSAGSDVAMIRPPDGSNGSNMRVEPPVDAGVAAPQTCAVDVTSSPTGAEVAIDKTNVLGTTPVTIELPCGVETKLYVRKAKYNGTIKSFTASAENTKLLVRLAPPMIQVKVTSMPPGATITVGGKVVGITPSTIKLPAQGASITLSKDGFIPDTQKIAPKANGAHHVNLKKGAVKQKLR